MDFSASNIIASVVFSMVGFFYLKHGKRVNEMRFAIFGMLLIVYGYFMPSAAWTIGVGVVLAAAPFLPFVKGG